MYVVGDERDLVRLRTDYRDEEVFLYRLRTTPEAVRALFGVYLERINSLADRPEWYHLLKSSCTINVVRYSRKVGHHPNSTTTRPGVHHPNRTMSTSSVHCIILAIATLAGSPHAALTQDPPPPVENEDIYGSYGDEGSLARASQNPVASLISLPLQSNFSFREDTGDLLYNLNVQPVVRFNLNEDWNLISRTSVPFFAMENAPGGRSAGDHPGARTVADGQPRP